MITRYRPGKRPESISSSTCRRAFRLFSRTSLRTPLERLDLVEHHHQPRKAGVAQDDEQALEEAEGAEVIEVALDASVPLGRGADVGLPADPGQQRVGGGALVPRHGPSPGAERRCERRRVAGDRSETPFHEIGRPRQERFAASPSATPPLGQNVFLQRGRTSCRGRIGGRTCCVSAVERRSVSRRYTVSRRCSGVSVSETCTSAVANPSRFARSCNQRTKKVLPLPYSPRTALNFALPAAHGCQLFAHHGLERLQADRERVEAAPRDGAAP